MLPAVDFRYLVEIRTEWNQAHMESESEIRTEWNQNRSGIRTEWNQGKSGTRTGLKLGKEQEYNQTKLRVTNQRGGFSLYMHLAASQALG